MKLILQQLLEKYNFAPAKIRGQNFLIDEVVLERIVAAGNISLDDTVLEIGPGFGFLTYRLSQKAKKVIAIEIDRRAVNSLRAELKAVANLEIVAADALRFDFKKYEIIPRHYLLIANIPYQITGKIFEKFLLSEYPPRRAVLLMQREVGERVLTKAGKHNFLSVILNLAYKIKEIEKVSREKFYPVPRVDSVVLAFDFTRPLNASCLTFIRQAFAHPKKKLINNLPVTRLPSRQWTETFRELGIDLNIRPGDVALDNWLNLLKKVNLLP